MATLKETPRFVDECIRSHFVEFIFNKSFNGDIFKDPTIFSSNQATKLEITLEEGWSDDLDPYYMDDYVFAGFIYAPINKNRYWFFATLQHVYLYIDALITKVNEIFQSTPNPKLLFKRVELWDCHEHFGGIHEFIEVTKSLKGYME
uniref:Uncharacterized protein n=1 Tax=Acrobeloides nanus TaxID=290746 RepID=A0A914D5W7_9BILA